LSSCPKRCELTQSQISTWKKMAKTALPEVFGSSSEKLAEQEEQMSALYEQLGRLKVELDFLKKNTTMSLEHKRMAIEPDHAQLSISAQCALLDLSCSSFYYEAAPCDALELDLMRRMDQLHTKHPFLGSRRLAVMLSTELGQFTRPELLHRGLGGLAASRQAAHLQHGSRLSVHQPALHQSAQGQEHPDQYGWPRSGAGQHLDRACVAQRQVRGGLPEQLSKRASSSQAAGRLL
jgi:hypothetical protein